MPAPGHESGHRGGRGNCLACALPIEQQDRLNRDLVRGVPLYRLSKQWSINRKWLRSHKANDITPALTALGVERSNGHGRSIADPVELLGMQADAIYEAARIVANMPLALKAHREHRADPELLAKLRGELDERPEVVVNVQQSQEWIDARTVSFEELESFPEVRARISKRLRVLAEQAETNDA